LSILSGTSQATAYVSAIASILLGQDNTRTSENLRTIITSTAVDQVGDPREDTPGWDQFYGYGRVDLYAALTNGKFPSGNKNEKTVDTNHDQEDVKAEHEDSKRAKADEPNNRKKEVNDNRAKKPEPDNNR
jgi:subtilisin family serine protease